MQRFARLSIIVALTGALAIAARRPHKEGIVHAQTSYKPAPDAPNLLPVPGAFPIYNPDGTLITNGRCVQAIVNSTTAGTWSVDYTPLGFTRITSFRADAANPSTSGLLSTQYFTSKNPATNTSFSGTVTMAVSVTIMSVSVPILQFATTSVPVSIGVCGS